MRRWLFRFLPLIFLPLLAGCWSNRPVELRAMVLAMGFSPGPHGEIRVRMEIPTTTGLASLKSGSSSSTGKLDYVLSASGLTPGMAETHIQSVLQTDLFLGQVQLVALSTHLTPRQLNLIIGYVTRLGPLDKTAYAVATPSVRQLFSTQPKAGQIPTLLLISGFSCSGCETIHYRQHIWQIETATPLSGDSIWMPYVTVVPSGFNTGRIIVYRHYTPAHIFSAKDSALLGLILGRTAKSYVGFKSHGQIIGVRTVTSKTSVHPTITKGRLRLKFRMDVTGTLDSWTGRGLTPRTLAWINDQCQEYLAPRLLKIVDLLQKDGSMPNGWLAPVIWRSEPSWKPTKVWESEYRRADVTIMVHFKLKDVGDAG